MAMHAARLIPPFLSLQGGIGKPLDEAEIKQFVGLAKAALDKLP